MHKDVIAKVAQKMSAKVVLFTTLRCEKSGRFQFELRSISLRAPTFSAYLRALRFTRYRTCIPLAIALSGKYSLNHRALFISKNSRSKRKLEIKYI